VLIKRSVFVLLIAFIFNSVSADTPGVRTSFSSGEQRIALIELFTSEGCNSCPPADRWLSKLKADPRLWKAFAPIALHVDYWDYIGWSDRFARSEYSSRQRQYVSEDGARFVYTPGFFRDGQEWQGWRRAGSVPTDTSRPGNLNVVVEDRAVAVRFTPAREYRSDLTVHVAVLGMDLETRVRSGENHGKTLRHDFVALNMTSVHLEPVNGNYRAVTRLPETSMQPRGLALVAWLSEGGKQAPIQAVGGYLSQR
jgi:hypothetical protein